MGDRYLQEHHAYAIAQKAHRGDLLQSRVSDQKSSWVMLSQRGSIVKLPDENILYQPRSRISFALSVPKALRARTPFSVESDNGEVYITNQRLIYLPSNPTENFKSFAAQILSFEDSHISSPLFGSWFWHATFQPVSGGGIPPEIPRMEVKLYFKDGGHNDFQREFVEIKERLHLARELVEGGGARVVIPDEDLPAYELRDPAPPAPHHESTSSESISAPQPGQDDNNQQPSPDNTTTTDQRARPSSDDDSENERGQRPPAPIEPPPDYDEAQAQQVSMRLEDHIREEADRS